MTQYALLLFATMFAWEAQAQTLYRCQSSIGQFSFQDRPCPTATVAGAVLGAQTNSYPSARHNGTGDWSRAQSVQRQRRTQTESDASASRVKAHLKSESDHRDAGHAASQRNCRGAMQIAALCGKFAGMFSCDSRGFVRESSKQPALLADRSMGKPASAFTMQRCALQAASGDLSAWDPQRLN